MLRILFLSGFLLQVLLLQGQEVVSYSQNQKKDYGSEMKQNLHVLASDSLQGREAGTQGELMARDYIVGFYKKLGILPIPGKDYTIPFLFSEGCSYSLGTMSFKSKTYEMDSHFFYLNHLVGYEFKGKTHFVGCGLTPKNYLGTDSVTNQGLVFVIDVNYSDTCHKIGNCLEYFDMVQSAVSLASERNPTAVILVSSDPKKYPVYSNWMLKPVRPTIPVVGADTKLSLQLLENKEDSVFSVNNFSKNEQTGYNVAAFIDNQKPTTIVLGAHYDHLGFGGFASRYNGPASIHNGADDNGSGTVLLLEMARRIKEAGYKNHNYLFVSFSAEEKGLLGSKAFLSQHNFDNSTMMAMLNFDMVGRLDSVEPRINLIGTGTSVQWDSLLTASDPGLIKQSRSSSGLGGSDQMSFYMHKIPVIFFITGMHKDYHTPYDDADKINYKGMVEVLCLAENIVVSLNGMDSLSFRETEAENSGSRKRSGVTLGIIPDHAWPGKGLRIDAVTPGKTASNFGFETGDVIVQIDDFIVSDIMSYMKALANYKKGDIAKITYLRGDFSTTVDVTF
ncbi:MAG: hypothetical protein CVU11_03595 [Bacteroidetes bacterium HGW-Bacteroidetes-6]|jgi:hypothetical protein|nr:MAG: hypothetical protein CVU11_03595 [Bacteroidetes bacterium HGW-Bacteroidetes-6]